MCAREHCYLPPFCHFTPEEWRGKGHEYDEIRDCGLYHDFTVEPGTGPVLIGEVSQCNDDETDNHFDPPMGRFPVVEEDEPPYRLLAGEYPPAGEVF